ncbi:SURF1 family protein [Nocardioides marmoribigeumensis]
MRVLVGPPLLLLHLAGVLAVSAAGWLGWWQVGAWQAHREDRAAAIATADPVPLDRALGPDDAFSGEDVGRPVEVRGQWLPQVLHVDQRHRTADPASASGAWQVGLLQVCDDGADCAGASTLPVVLGWTPTTQGGLAPRGRVDLTGWLQPSESSDEVGGPVTGDVLPALRTADLLDRVPHDVYSGYVILRSPAAQRGDLVPVTPESLPDPPASTALRNLFYGVEWWVFAGFAAYLWFQWSRDAVRTAQGRGGTDGTDGTAGTDGEGPTADPTPDPRPIVSSP